MKKLFYQVTVANSTLLDGFNDARTGQMYIANYDNPASVYANLKNFFLCVVPEPSKDTAYSIARYIVTLAERIFNSEFVGCDEDIPLCGSQYKRIHFKCALKDY